MISPASYPRLVSVMDHFDDNIISNDWVRQLPFHTGSGEFTPGQIVTGTTSLATATIVSVVVTSGGWGTGNAVGYLFINGGNNTAFTETEAITDPILGVAIVFGSSLAITESTTLNFVDTGVAGDAIVQSVREFGPQTVIFYTGSMITGSAPGDGAKALMGIELYNSSDDYVRLAMYREGAINDQAYLTEKVGGGALVNVALAGLALDAADHTTMIVVAENTLMFFLDGDYIGGRPINNLQRYHVRLICGTKNAGDNIDARYDLGMIQDSLIFDVSSNMIITPSNVIGSGSLTINDTLPHQIDFLETVYGSDFELSLAMDLSGAKIDYCRLSDAGVFTNQDILAKDYGRPIYLVPPGGSAINDAIYFGLATKALRLDVIMTGGTLNTDNTYAWEFYNGAAWVALVGLADGTQPGGGRAFGQDGTVTWTSVLSQATVNGVLAYWIRSRITANGISIPVATHIQFSPLAAVDFDSLAVIGSHVDVSLFRMFGTIYPEKPQDLWPYQQSFLTKNVEFNGIRCYGTIKIVLTMDTTPTAAITVPYRFIVKRS